MDLLEKLQIDAEEIVIRMKSGEKISKEDREILQIFNRLNGNYAGNAGKRKKEKTGK